MPPFSNEERRTRAEDGFWSMLGTLYQWRRFLIGMTAGMAVLAVVLSLMLDNWYRADTRLLLPSRSGAGLVSTALMGELPSAARSLLGGAGGDYARYLTILSGRTVFESVVDHFDLITVYETADSKTPQADAIRALDDNVDLVIDEEYEFLSVQVLDKDPQRAADMANFFVAELQRLNSELASRSAANFRRYVEQSYNEAETELDSVLNALRTFQEKYGVLNLEAQGELFFEYVGDLRVQALLSETQYETLLSQFGPNNSMVQAARESAQSANRKYSQAMEGEERLLPIPKEQFPEVARAFIELEKERIILTRLIEFTRPALEEARFDEQRQVEAVQVVDVAVPPAKKAKPTRSIICIAATLSAFILNILFVLTYTWWRRNYRYYAERLQAAAGEEAAAPPAARPTESPQTTTSA